MTSVGAPHGRTPGYLVALTIATMPALTAAGSVGHTSMTAARSGSRAGGFGSTAPGFAPKPFASFRNSLSGLTFRLALADF